MRVTLVSLVMLVAACTEMPVSGGAPTAGDTLGSAQQAYFAGRPDQLFNAAAALCDGPGQNVVMPNTNEVRCESLPDPESAAGLILQFDGTVEDLPKLVISFSGRDTTSGFLVTIDSYIRVPGRDGGAQQIRFEDQRMADSLSELLQTAGGRPL